MSKARQDAWQRLIDAVSDIREQGFTETANRELHLASLEYASHSGYTKVVGPGASRGQGASGGLVFPNYGRSKGQPVKGASRQDLEFYRNGCERTLNDPSKARFHAKERELLAAIDEELGQ